jgi:hypothetical protein
MYYKTSRSFTGHPCYPCIVSPRTNLCPKTKSTPTPHNANDLALAGVHVRQPAASRSTASIFRISVPIKGLSHTNTTQMIRFNELRNWIISSFEPCGHFNGSSVLVGISSILATEQSLLSTAASPARVINKWPDNTWTKSTVRDNLSICKCSNGVVNITGWQ